MRALIPVLLVVLAACSKSPSAPSGAQSAGMLEGQAVSALDGAAIPGVSVSVGGTRAVTTDAGGLFQVDMEDAGTYPASLRNGAFVERDTSVAAPAQGRARLSLIPATFDLEFFDQMFRTSHARLQRWTSAPHLVVVASVMNYRGASEGDYPAIDEQLTEAEVAQMVEHLTAGLTLLTGGSYTSFATVEIERPSSGARVRIERDHRIVVGRYSGIVSYARTIGYGSWAEQPDGTITGGALFLDRDFDRSDVRRRLLRIHELGHALGYQHVTSRASIMNPAIGAEPTETDRAGALIAFQRPPGNRSPDTDPYSSSARLFSSVGAPARWSTVFCR